MTEEGKQEDLKKGKAPAQVLQLNLSIYYLSYYIMNFNMKIHFKMNITREVNSLSTSAALLL